MRVALLILVALVVACPASADEFWIVFGSFRGGDFSSSVHAIRPDGSGERQISPHIAGHPPSLDPWVKPDGDLIIFGRGGSNHKTAVWLQDTATGDEEQVTGLVMVRFRSGRTWPSIRPNTYALTYVLEATNERRIAMQDWPGGEQLDLGPGEFPSWSPEGDKLAFEREGAIWIRDFNTGLVGEVEIDLSSVGYPAWHPDGDRLLVVGADGPAVDLFEVSLEGEVIRQLTDSASVKEAAPAWSPDGRYIAFAASASSPRIGWEKSIYVLEPESGDIREVTTGDYNDTRPTWVEKLPK